MHVGKTNWDAIGLLCLCLILTERCFDNEAICFRAVSIGRRLNKFATFSSLEDGPKISRRY